MKFRPASLSLLSLLAPLAVVLPVATVDAPAPGRAVEPEVRQLALAGVDRGALRRMPRLLQTPTVLTAERSTDEFSAVGVTWARGTGGPAVRVDVRTRTGGQWTGWASVELDDPPDATTAEARAAGVRDGTTALWVGKSDGVQVRVVAPRTQAPRDLRLELIDPGTSEADRDLGRSAAPASSAYAEVARPAIITRRQWGADERLRSGSPAYSSRAVMGVLHHTASTNNYTAAQAAAQVRAMYAFHTRSRGWSDLGYNFLVDKWGRVYEGRYGGLDRNVIGAHTSGFNSRTFGVSMIGNYESVTPPAAMARAVQRVFAWKLGLNYRDPFSNATLTSGGGGTSRYPAGRTVTLRTISGHRDVGYTVCPGARGYALMWPLRQAVRDLTGAALFDPSTSSSRVPYGSGETIAITSSVAKTQTWTVDIRDAVTGATLRTFAGTASPASKLRASWDLTGAAGALAPPGRYIVTITSAAGTQQARPWTDEIVIESAPVPSGVAVKDLRDGVYKVVEAGHLVTPSAALMKAYRAPGTAIPGAPDRLATFASDAARPLEGSVWQSATTRWRWVVSNGQRRSLAPHVVTALGLPAEPPALPESVLTTVPVGAAWTSTTRHPDGTLVFSAAAAWRLESGLRRPFTSEAVARAWAVGRQALPALPGDLALPEGPVLGPPEGALLRLPTLSYAVVSGGRLRQFLEPATMTALGYSTGTALAATPADLAALPLGPAIPAGAQVHPSGTLLLDVGTYWEVVGAGRRVVSPILARRDFRTALAPLPGELSALAPATARAPEGFAGRGLDGAVRVLTEGRVVRLSPDVALALYDVAALPALELADFGLGEEAVALVRTDRHPDGTIVYADETGWLLAGGERRPLSLAAIGSYTGVPVRPALAGDLELPVGKPAGARSGSWVRVPSGERFVVEDGVRRPVSDSYARSTGLAAVPVTPLTDAELAASTTLGPVLG